MTALRRHAGAFFKFESPADAVSECKLKSCGGLFTQSNRHIGNYIGHGC